MHQDTVLQSPPGHQHVGITMFLSVRLVADICELPIVDNGIESLLGVEQTPISL